MYLLSVKFLFDYCGTGRGHLALFSGTPLTFGCYSRSNWLGSLRDVWSTCSSASYWVASWCSLCPVLHHDASVCEAGSTCLQAHPAALGCVPTQDLIKPIWGIIRTPLFRSWSSFCCFLQPKLICTQSVSIIKPNLQHTESSLYSGVRWEPARGVMSLHMDRAGATARGKLLSTTSSLGLFVFYLPLASFSCSPTDSEERGVATPACIENLGLKSISRIRIQGWGGCSEISATVVFI